jgi:hypothetical protein
MQSAVIKRMIVVLGSRSVGTYDLVSLVFSYYILEHEMPLTGKSSLIYQFIAINEFPGDNRKAFYGQTFTKRTHHNDTTYDCEVVDTVGLVSKNHVCSSYCINRQLLSGRAFD